MKLFKLLLLLILIAGAIPTLLVGLFSVLRTRELLVQDAQELAAERVERLRLKVMRALDEPLRSVRAISAIPNLLSRSTEEQQAQLGAALKQNPSLLVVSLFDATGKRLPGAQGFAVNEVPPSQIAAAVPRAQALIAARQPVAFSEVRSTEGGSAQVTIAMSLGEPTEGYVVADLSLATLASVVGNEPLGAEARVYVLDSRLSLIAAQGLPSMTVGAQLSERPAVIHLERSRSTRQNGSTQVGAFGDGGERVVAASAQMSDTGWFVVFEQPIERAYSQVAVLERQVALGVTAGVAVALVLAWLFSRTVTSPLGGFRAQALAIAQGQFGVQVDVRAKNELGELARTFNYMSLQIDAYDQETKRLYESLEKGYLETILALANSIDSKDPYTRGHSQRVGEMAVDIGRELGLTERELKLLRYGGILHDIGKIGIVDSILSKQSRLTDEEMLTMRDHPLIGDSIVGPISFLASVRSAVRSHHERWDGTGYPDGLKGKEIPLIARIVNAADTLDACTSTRPYQRALPIRKALDILESLRGTQLDPEVLDALRQVLTKKGALGEAPRDSEKLAS